MRSAGTLYTSDKCNRVNSIDQIHLSMQAPADSEYQDACTLARELLKKFKTIQPENLHQEGQDLLQEMQKQAMSNKTFAALLA